MSYAIEWRPSARKQVRRLAEEKLGAVTVDEALLVVAERVDLLAEGIDAYAQRRSDRGGLDEGSREGSGGARRQGGLRTGPAWVPRSAGGKEGRDDEPRPECALAVPKHCP